MEQTAIILLITGLLGMTFIVFSKIPTLSALSDRKNEKTTLAEKIKNRFATNKTNGKIHGEVLLQKILSKFWILILKTECKTNGWLCKLRQRSLENRKNLPGDYWKKIKESERGEKKLLK